MAQIKWTILALQDLKNIYNYINKDSPKYAKIQVIKIRVRTNILKTNPLSGRAIPEYGNESFRELIEGNYRIIYKLISKTRIDIITIHHSARDLGKRKLS